MRKLIILMVVVSGLFLIPAAASAQISIQTPGWGVSVGPNGGVGVRVGGVYGGVPPGPPVVYAPAPLYPPVPPVIVVPPRPARYLPPPPPYYPPRPAFYR
jgi:hypothetical protein